MSHIGLHNFEPNKFYGGRCGAIVEQRSPGHQIICGAVRDAPTHKCCTFCRKAKATTGLYGQYCEGCWPTATTLAQGER